MKRIGLLGGMSWESSAQYYRFVNRAVRDRLGGLHSADCLLRSVDFAAVEELQRTGRWDQASKLLAAEAMALAAGGAELLVLCTNTMHRVADQIAAAVAVPLVHIADTTAEAVHVAGLSRVGLLATAYTMEQDFYVGRLERMHGLAVVVPGADDRRVVHQVIYRELCVGIVKEDSRETYRRVIGALVERGAEGILYPVARGNRSRCSARSTPCPRSRRWQGLRLRCHRRPVHGQPRPPPLADPLHHLHRRFRGQPA